MGFLDLVSNVVSSTVKVALTPIAIVKDAGNIAIGLEADSTKDLLKSAAKDMKEAGDEIA